MLLQSPVWLRISQFTCPHLRSVFIPSYSLCPNAAVYSKNSLIPSGNKLLFTDVFYKLNLSGTGWPTWDAWLCCGSSLIRMTWCCGNKPTLSRALSASWWNLHSRSERSCRKQEVSRPVLPLLPPLRLAHPFSIHPGKLWTPQTWSVWQHLGECHILRGVWSIP